MIIYHNHTVNVSQNNIWYIFDKVLYNRRVGDYFWTCDENLLYTIIVIEHYFTIRKDISEYYWYINEK